MKHMRFSFDYIFNLRRVYKQALQIFWDVLSIIFSFWLSAELRLEGTGLHLPEYAWILPLLLSPFTIILFMGMGLYGGSVRYMSSRGVGLILVGAFLSSAAFFILNLILTFTVPRSIPGIYCVVLIVTLVGGRFLLRGLYWRSVDKIRQPVLVVGAEADLVPLIATVGQSTRFRPAVFAATHYSGDVKTVGSTEIVDLAELERPLERRGIKIALVAMRNGYDATARNVALKLSTYGLEVRFVSNISDFIAGRTRVSELTKMQIEDLLGRSTVAPRADLISASNSGRNVLITGGAGSIGSEICLQLLQLSPAKIVVLDSSELALYKLQEVLDTTHSTLNKNFEVIPILGSISDRTLLENIISKNDIDTVYHAAAYKHVPLVEANVATGIINNVFGFETTADVCGSLGVKNFILISSDKAVRPTNVMGATKRLCELLLIEKSRFYRNTNFCAVRFGNVVGSSGSVIPKFRRQIEAGGPITVTHPEVTRYFMTVAEAAQLVLHASALSQSGEIYFLDMGEPVKIFDIARSLLNTYGIPLGSNTMGSSGEKGIEIKITGLRPGEKLFEELLVGGRSEKTVHPKIFRDVTKINLGSEFGEGIKKLKIKAQQGDHSGIFDILKDFPIEYFPSSPDVS